MITNTEIAVVISNNKNAYALGASENRHGIEAVCISPKDYENREQFNEAFVENIDDSYQVDLIGTGRLFSSHPACR